MNEVQNSTIIKIRLSCVFRGILFELMKAFSETDRHHQIQQHFQDLANTPCKVHEGQIPLLQAILDSQWFQQIANCFGQLQEYQGEVLTSGDPAIVGLKCLGMIQKVEQDQELHDKLDRGIDKLWQLISEVEEYNQTAVSKLQWLQAETQKYSEAIEDIREDIDIIKAQDKKRGGAQSKSDNQPEQDEWLKETLSKYRCEDKPFPRNKTQALMLLNRVQGMIQKAQLSQLSSLGVYNL